MTSTDANGILDGLRGKNGINNAKFNGNRDFDVADPLSTLPEEISERYRQIQNRMKAQSEAE